MAIFFVDRNSQIIPMPIILKALLAGSYADKQGKQGKDKHISPLAKATMKSLIQQTMLTIIALILFSYGTAIGLTFIHNPTPQQIEIIQALITNASKGSQAFFQLVSGENLKALLQKFLE